VVFISHLIVKNWRFSRISNFFVLPRLYETDFDCRFFVLIFVRGFWNKEMKGAVLEQIAPLFIRQPRNQNILISGLTHK